MILLMYIFLQRILRRKALCSVLSRHWAEIALIKHTNKKKTMRAGHREWSMLLLVSKAHLPRADVLFFVVNFHTLKSLSFPLIFSLGYKNANSIFLSAHNIFSKSPAITITLLRQINCAYIFLEPQWPKLIQYFNLIIQSRAEQKVQLCTFSRLFYRLFMPIHAHTSFLNNAALLTLIL